MSIKPLRFMRQGDRLIVEQTDWLTPEIIEGVSRILAQYFHMLEDQVILTTMELAEIIKEGNRLDNHDCADCRANIQILLSMSGMSADIPENRIVH